VEFIDSDGGIIVPKAVRPLIEVEESLLGSKNGARKQYRFGKLHVREYDDYYSVHMDKVDPAKDPFGHLVVDAPEYLAGAVVGLAVGKRTGVMAFRESRKKGKSGRDAAFDALISGYLAGSSAGKIAYSIVTNLKKKQQQGQAGT
jgi:hypothetical protein